MKKSAPEVADWQVVGPSWPRALFRFASLMFLNIELIFRNFEFSHTNFLVWFILKTQQTVKWKCLRGTMHWARIEGPGKMHLSLDPSAPRDLEGEQTSWVSPGFCCPHGSVINEVLLAVTEAITAVSTRIWLHYEQPHWYSSLSCGFEHFYSPPISLYSLFQWSDNRRPLLLDSYFCGTKAHYFTISPSFERDYHVRDWLINIYVKYCIMIILHPDLVKSKSISSFPR